MKDIKDFEGLYAITMSGRVWSYKSKKFLKPSADRYGYLKVTLYKNGKRKDNVPIHRLVAETYLPNPDNQPQVGHIDDNPKNNCWDNLYWTNNYNNMHHGHRGEVYKTMKRDSLGRFCK